MIKCRFEVANVTAYIALMGSLCEQAEDECLENISEEYSKKVTRELNVFLGLLQPLLLAFCAGFLLLIVLAFIIPVYGNLSNIAGGNVKF